MFEKFQVQALQVNLSPVLSLYSTGRKSGYVFESGHDVTSAVAVYKGFGIVSTMCKNFIAGREITERLKKLLNDEGIQVSNVAQKIKEQICFVSYSPQEDLVKTSQNNENVKQYLLPDGQTVEINSPRFMAPEILFNPAIIDGYHDIPGIVSFLSQTIENSNIQVRNDLGKRILLSGGNTSFTGLAQRFSKEVKDFPKIAALSENVQFYETETKSESAWIGGSVLSELNSFCSSWIEKQEWNENGINIIIKKKLY